MVCIYCGHDSKVTNSRPNKRSQQIWRRRQCLQCGRVWSTYEAADSASLVMVRSRQEKALTPFLRDKLYVSVLNSLGHRPDKVNEASALITTLLPLIYKTQQDAVIDATILAKLVAQTLHNFDAAAEVHYRAFHHL